MICVTVYTHLSCGSCDLCLHTICRSCDLCVHVCHVDNVISVYGVCVDHVIFLYRYPAIEWSLIGEFKARTDVRTVQTFPLDESVYAKYIKVLCYPPLFIFPPALFIYQTTHLLYEVYCHIVLLYLCKVINHIDNQ